LVRRGRKGDNIIACDALTGMIPVGRELRARIEVQEVLVRFHGFPVTAEFLLHQGPVKPGERECPVELYSSHVAGQRLFQSIPGLGALRRGDIGIKGIQGISLEKPELVSAAVQVQRTLTQSDTLFPESMLLKKSHAGGVGPFLLRR